MERIEEACSLFEKGFACSQAVLAAYCDLFGFDRETLVRLAGGFGGGMGRMGLTCGAVTGGFMVIGLKYGASSPEDRQAKEKTHAMIREFARRFEEKHGTLVCKELIGCDISTRAGYKQAREKECFTKICSKLVRDAAEIVGAMIS